MTMTWLLRLAKSKTILFNVLGLAALIVASPQLALWGAPETIAKVLAVVNLLLRFVTVEPLSAKA